MTVNKDSMGGSYEVVPQKDARNGAGSPVAGADGSSDQAGVQMKASLGLLQGCTVIVGSIIGSGIFISPSGVLQNTGSINMALVVWVISGLFSMIGAYCYAELGCMIRKSGADYSYILDTFGPFMGFMRLWAECIIVRPCTITIVALTFAKYGVKSLFPECEPPDDAVRILAAVCICKENFQLYEPTCFSTSVKTFLLRKSRSSLCFQVC